MNLNQNSGPAQEFSPLDLFWQQLYDKYAQEQAMTKVKEKQKAKFPLVLWILFFIFSPPISIVVLVLMSIFNQNKKTNTRAERILSYIRVMRTRAYYAGFGPLANAAGVTEDVVRLDLTEMIAAGELPGAVFDFQNRCIHLDTIQPGKVQKPVTPVAVPPAIRKAVIKSDKVGHKYPPTAMSVPQDTPLKDAGTFYLSRLDDLHSQANQQLAPNIQELYQHLSKLLTYGYHHQKCAQTIQNFLYRYLPSTLKLITAALDFSDFSDVSADMAKTHNNIVEVLDTMTRACDKQLQQLYQSDAIDISSDITVMENMLSQEGLLSDMPELKIPLSDEENEMEL